MPVTVHTLSDPCAKRCKCGSSNSTYNDFTGSSADRRLAQTGSGLAQFAEGQDDDLDAIRTPTSLPRVTCKSTLASPDAEFDPYRSSFNSAASRWAGGYASLRLTCGLSSVFATDRHDRTHNTTHAGTPRSCHGHTVALGPAPFPQRLFGVNWSRTSNVLRGPGRAILAWPPGHSCTTGWSSANASLLSRNGRSTSFCSLPRSTTSSFSRLGARLFVRPLDLLYTV